MVTFFTFARVKQLQLSTEQTVGAFAALGEIMLDGAAGVTSGPAGRFAELIDNLHLSNPWFTPENVRHAVAAVGDSLTAGKLAKWLSAYPDLQDYREPETVGVVMAGNIPLVGFHDLLCVLVTGNRLQAKLSSRDEIMMKTVARTLVTIEPAFDGMIRFTPGNLKGFSRVIATGSNNTSRYFDYYFRNIPSVIRKNRNSVAVIDGTETADELRRLGDDIFIYFGLGCRNISKIWLPEGYDPARLISHWANWEYLSSHYKYSVNYDHNKAVMIINRENFADGGFILLRQSPSLSPPMAVVNFEFYRPGDLPFSPPEAGTELLQCIAGHGQLPFGTTQQPELWDYADNMDTVSFLLKKNLAR